jgi:hypothetical protein
MHRVGFDGCPVRRPDVDVDADDRSVRSASAGGVQLEQ